MTVTKEQALSWLEDLDALVRHYTPHGRGTDKEFGLKAVAGLVQFIEQSAATPQPAASLKPAPGMPGYTDIGGGVVVQNSIVDAIRAAMAQATKGE